MRRTCTFFTGLLLAALAFGVQSAHAAAGSLDPTFGRNGVTVTPLANTEQTFNSMLLLNGDKILVFEGGTTLLQYTSNGALDTTFGNGGVAVLSTPISSSLAVQPNGQIVIGRFVFSASGGFELGVERLNANGSLDTNFGSGGVAVVSLGTRDPSGAGSAVLIETNGDIVVGTQLVPTGRREPTQTALARFTSTGALDISFGTQGLSIQTPPSGCSALAELSTGELLVVDAFLIAQYTANGSAEPKVTGGTIVARSQSSSVFVPIFEAGGDYLFGFEVFVGQESRGHDSSAQVLRFSETGAQLDNVLFHYVGNGGSGIEAIVRAVAVQANGDIVAVGSQTTFSQSGQTVVNGLARLKLQNVSLVLDPTFGSGGTEVNNLAVSSGVVVQSTGKIVTAGIANSELTVARYLGQ